MESYILISELNDFLFCPRSVYLHHVYRSYAKQNYHREAQIKGSLAHKRIEDKRYSTSAHLISGLEVYSERYGIGGKIDIYDAKKRHLIERKRQIKKIYAGYCHQIFAQYFCMTEMGYPVEALFLHSLLDNKRYRIPLPETKEIQKFERLLRAFRHYKLTQKFLPNPNKCRNCIYSELCDLAVDG